MKIRLQTSIAVLLLGSIVPTIAALGASSYYLSRDSAEQLRGRILGDTAQDVYGEITRILEPARNQTAYDRKRLQEGAVSPTDFPALARSWLRPMEICPELAFILLALPNGDTLRLARSANGQFYLQEWRFDAARKKRHLRVFAPKDYPDRPRYETDDERVHDLGKHPVMQAAARAAAGQQVWTECYGFLGEQLFPGGPGTTCVTPVNDKDGSRIGVLAAGVDVRSLCNYLQTLKVGKEGYVFVVELQDRKPAAVIAHPSADIAWRKLTAGPRAGDVELVPASEISDGRVQAFMAQLPAVIDTGSHAKFMNVDFEFGGERYCGGYEYVKDLPDVDTPEWIICIIMPEREIMAGVWRNNWLMLGIGAATLTLGILASLYLARQVARPLEQVTGETRAIGRLECAPRPPVESRVQEVSDLGIAIEEMKTSLRSFQKYVPADLVRTLLLSKLEARPGGVSRTLTVFFCDVANFTTLSEQLSPTNLVEQLGEFLSGLSGQISAAGGTVDKYIGDAIMAFWGAPLPNPQHALGACIATMRCQAILRALGQKWQTAGRPLFSARFGLNTGEVVVGNIGSETRMNYTVIGDTVNVASRLEGLNKFYGTQALISETTYREAGPEVVARRLDWVSLKGKKQPLLVYELLGLRTEARPEAQELADMYGQALERYRQQDWEHALKLFGAVIRLRPDDVPSQLMSARCRAYQQQPPNEDWDGVHHLSEK
jgi:adenylate cyclase